MDLVGFMLNCWSVLVLMVVDLCLCFVLQKLVKIFAM